MTIVARTASGIASDALRMNVTSARSDPIHSLRMMTFASGNSVALASSDRSANETAALLLFNAMCHKSPEKRS